MNQVKVLIVDDETLARKRVAHMLKKHQIVSIIGECKSGLEAYNFIQHSRPDLILLDIQMPDMNGIEFVNTTGIHKLPPIIFITAHDTYAVKAFELHAVDYLLKPFDANRFDDAFNRALQRISTNPAIKQKKNIANAIQKYSIEKDFVSNRLFIKESGLIQVIEIDTIDYIASAGNYVNIYSQQKKYLYRHTMKDLINKLPNEFIRVHRSYIVNSKKITKLVPLNSGDYTIYLKKDIQITLSRRFKQNLDSL